MNEHAPLLPVTAASAPRRKNWVAIIAAAAVVSFALGAVVVSSSSTATQLDGGAEGPVVEGKFGAVRGRFGRAPTDYETCRCCELITYVGDPNCDEGSSFLNALSAAGANEVHSYIRTPDDPNTWFAPTWAEASCGTLSDNVTKTEGCAVCGSCTLAAFSRDQCDAIQPQLDYGGDRTNKEADAGCTGAPFEETVEFVGIPYAEPPVGNLRWRAPRPIGPWIGEVRDASTVPPACVHWYDGGEPLFGHREKLYSEDCLYLSVVAPREKSSKLPVLVYIYGGSFWSGDTSLYTETSAAQKVATAGDGAIFVIMNYRLGPLGFLASTELAAETGEASMGNFGFADQRLALRWVKDNIESFGGDPGRITVAGDSAGGISVLGHLTSKLTPPDLFAAAFAISGTADTSAFFPLDEATTRGAGFLRCARAYAAARGHPCPEHVSDVECARSLSAEEVDFIHNPYHYDVVEKLFQDICGESFSKEAGAFHPTLDGVEWTDLPLEMAKRGEFSTDARVVMGDVANEMSRFVLQKAPDITSIPAAAAEAILAAVPSILKEGYAVEEARRVLERYYDPTRFEGDTYPAYRSVEALFTDALFNCPNREFALGLAAAGRPVYLYLNTHVADQCGGTAGHPSDLVGAMHGSDPSYFFGNRWSASTPLYQNQLDEGDHLPCPPSAPRLDPPFDENTYQKLTQMLNETGHLDPELIDPRIYAQCGPAELDVNSCAFDPGTLAAVTGYRTSFLADGEPGDADGTEPFWPRFEAGGMKRVIIGNSTRVESFVSEACDLWKEVDTAKLQGLVMGFLMNGNSSTPPD